MPVRKKRTLVKKKNHSSSTSKRRSKDEEYGDFLANSSGVQHIKTRRITNYDTSGVRRIFSPYNRFLTTRKTEKMPSQNPRQCTGLTQKEKSYLICSCQTKSTRYGMLKSLAAKAIKENKIFSIHGSCNAVRNALIERGWVEKIPPKRMNLSKIRNGSFSDKKEIKTELEKILLSNLVEKCHPNFIWRTTDDRRDTTIDLTKECNTIINKLEIDAMWTSKQGLCSSIKRNYWFYIEDMAEVNGPRTYNITDFSELEGFEKDYKITACTSLLKWILSMVANDRPVFVNTGKISMNIVVFALNRCKEYLFRKQNKDIDRNIAVISDGQWNSFLKKYYCVISKDEVFQCDKENKLPLYLSYAKFLLKEIHRYRPQLSCEGCHNIWIIKPAHCSRGRGIRMASKLGVIMNLLSKANSKYVIQKYIEEPLLIHETKFDIRQYYLVTSTYPLVIWMYTDCYLKFSSQKYSLKNYHESIHLTNNAVQRKYDNCKGRHSELPHSNMWDLDKYKNYLKKIGKDKIWDKVIYPGMKKIIIGIMLSCQDTLSVCKNRFELYGCDFILDKEFKPWLIEINCCPDLNHTTQVTAKICPEVVADIIKVVIDHASDPKTSTGKFECIYRQPMSQPRYGAAIDLSVRGYSLPYEYFYKGNVEIKETYADPDIGKECDIKGIINKLKQFYDTETVMVQPEDDSVFLECNDEDTSCAQTSSEYEMSVKVAVISGQLDELLDRIVSEKSDNENSSLQQELKTVSLYSAKNSLSRLQIVSSVTDIKSFMKKSIGRVASETSLQKTFSFSQLSDGSHKQSSLVKLHSLDKLLCKFPLNDNTLSQKNQYPIMEANKSSQDNVFLATSKIISFINDKEKEYSKHLRSAY